MNSDADEDNGESSVHLAVPIPFGGEEQPLLMDGPAVQGASRHRSNTISSIMSGYEIVKEYFDKKKFIYLLLASLTVYCAFLAAFAPRTSLVRDIRRINSSKITEAEVYRIFLDTMHEYNGAQDHLRNYTHQGHSTGDHDSLEYTVEQFKQMGFEPKLEKYYPWINKPIHTGVTLYRKDKIAFEATMLEDCVLNDPTSCSEDRIRGYHAYSSDGEVRAPYVFCNYGTLSDYLKLLEAGIDIEDKIHIIRIGSISQGLKLRNAELYGASGVITYNDPQDDGKITAKHGFLTYPDGPARNPSSIERGSVAFLTDFSGDPTTPGYPSKYPTIERLSPVGKIPTIPSVPMSAKEVAPLLRELNGYGLQLDNHGDIEGFDYSTGPSPDGVEIFLQNEQDYQTVELTNVVVEIPGIFQEYDIIIGNHRDSWGVGGAGVSNSGSAILLETARGFSKLLKRGWKPFKPIKLISWDGGSPGMLGSTEHAEDHSQTIKKNTLAYLNLDSAITGTQFHCEMNPLLYEIIRKATKYTSFKMEDWSLFDEWKSISNLTDDKLSVETDLTPFQYHLGIPSSSCRFQNNGSGDPIFAPNSNYDTFTWIETQVDPEYKLHNTLAVLTGLTTLMLSEKELIPFKTHPYFVKVQTHFEKYHRQLLSTFPYDKQLCRLAKTVSNLLQSLSTNESRLFDKTNAHLNSQLIQDFPGWFFYKKISLYIRLLRANSKLKQLDQLFLTKRGLEDRPWMKHSLFAPSTQIGLQETILPSINGALQDYDRDKIIESLVMLLTQFHNVKSLME
ncbi:hypothetical protein ZYGR_0AG06280 [Zygosaccharomyces rouxii]|uniref:Vacuolar protein sorting-associated protein 70 n=1 Tax=Zygosaccharomyces rouxii TaxID=4956 RepID=A0A1Q3AAA0_ZYGRO|nr:hypothetical protein ZYGR_0AG06280 [Zygosaccharomyces rouxii]